MSSTTPEVHSISQRRQKAEPRHRQHAQNVVKIAPMVQEISSPTDRQSHTHIDVLIIAPFLPVRR